MADEKNEKPQRCDGCLLSLWLWDRQVCYRILSPAGYPHRICIDVIIHGPDALRGHDSWRSVIVSLFISSIKLETVDWGINYLNHMPTCHFVV